MYGCRSNVLQHQLSSDPTAKAAATQMPGVASSATLIRTAAGGADEPKLQPQQVFPPMHHGRAYAIQIFIRSYHKYTHMLMVC